MLRPYVGGDSHPNPIALSDIGQGPNVDLHKLLKDDANDDEAAHDILKDQSCNYFEPDEVYKHVDLNSFSLLSHNIRSLSGHFESFKDSLYSMLPATFSVTKFSKLTSSTSF